MPSRMGKVTAKKIHPREPSPEIGTPIKPNDKNDVQNNPDRVVLKRRRSFLDEPHSNENAPETIDALTIVLANGQPLLTNFEEQYLIDLLVRTTTKDIETILRDKINFITEMNYGSHLLPSSLNPSWIFDFVLKHFKPIADHINHQHVFDTILNRTYDKQNATLAFKHWQLQILVNEHTKQTPTPPPTKRRMTVRRLALSQT